jgi:hypothetical protein
MSALPALLTASDPVADDAAWARYYLRHEDGKIIIDLANCLRIFEMHPDFRGRFKYNDTLNKVLDRGGVMLEWRISEITAILQERFMPGVPFEIVQRALVVASNRAMQVT